jgi:tetratricopeptide (TPR) repeat protein
MKLLHVLHRSFVASAAPLLLLAAALPAAGQSIPGYPEHVTDYDPREVVMLPRFCPHTQLFRERVPGGNDPEAIRHWHSLMGDIFLAMHHYCWGLMHLNRAKILARDAQVRSFNYASAVNEFDYVLRQARSDFVLLPEILTKRGEALLGLGKAAQALAEFERAIELRRDYWPPYAQIADFHQRQGDREKARAVLQAGLKYAPEATGLQRRLRELDEPLSESPAGRSAK